MPPDRAALLIIRAWSEPGSVRPLRAQIRFTTDVAAGLRPPLNLADAASVTSAVEAWLGSVLDGTEPAEQHTGPPPDDA